MVTGRVKNAKNNDSISFNAEKDFVWKSSR